MPRCDAFPFFAGMYANMQLLFERPVSQKSQNDSIQYEKHVSFVDP